MPCILMEGLGQLVQTMVPASIRSATTSHALNNPGKLQQTLLLTTSLLLRVQVHS